jgi:predicted RNA binding protein with dsRBD fold (UPF0201 family)
MDNFFNYNTLYSNDSNRMQFRMVYWRVRYMTESAEALLRQKAILIIARKGWTKYAYKRVIDRLKKCLNG